MRGLTVEPLLLLVAAGIDVGRSGGGKMLLLVTAGMEVPGPEEAG